MPSQGGARFANEGVLVAALKANDDAAFEHVVRALGGRMLAVATRLLRDPGQAADAVQDAYVSMIRSIHRFDGASKLSTWLHRIVVNAALMRLRSAGRRDERSIDDLLPTWYPDGCRRNPRDAWTADGESLLERRESRAMIRRAIDTLPEDYRTVLLLRDVEGLDTEAAAEALGTTPGAVKTRLHRARMALRELLEKELT